MKDCPGARSAVACSPLFEVTRFYENPFALVTGAPNLISSPKRHCASIIDLRATFTAAMDLSSKPNAERPPVQVIPPPTLAVNWRNELGAGLMASLVSLPLCMACGLLVYAPLGPNYVAHGAAAGLYGGAVVGAVAALIASSTFIITTGRVSMALVQAGLVGALVARPALASEPGLIIVAATLCLLLAGLWQVLFAAARIANAIKFVPQPVLTGLLNGIGALIIISQLKPYFRDAGVQRLLPDRPLMLIFVLLLTWFIMQYGTVAGYLRLPDALKKVPGSLAGLIAGTAAYYLIVQVFPVDLGSTLGDLNLSFPPHSPLMSLLTAPIDPRLVAVLPEIVVVSLVLAIIATVEALLGFRVAQTLDDTEIKPVRDLAAQGAANSAAALAGGIGGSAIPSILLVAYRLGGRTRLTGIISAVALLVMALGLAPLLARVPDAVFAAILMVIGLILFDRWNLQLIAGVFGKGAPLVRRQAIYDLAVVLAVMLVTVFSSVVAGVIVGCVLSGIIFVVRMSRPMVRQTYFGHEIFSKRFRLAEETAALLENGPRRAVLQLEGVLFFGNAEDLSSQVRALFERTDYVLLDMRGVAEIDISGARVLEALVERGRARGKQVIFCNVGPVQAAFLGSVLPPKRLPPITQDLDTALEWIEQRTLEARPKHDATRELAFQEIDFFAGLPEDELKELASVMRRREYKPGDTVCAEGEAADCMWLIVKGSVSARRRDAGGESHRIAALGRGTTVGEMALVEPSLRTATVVADEDCVCYELPREGFDILLKEYPELGAHLLENLARELSRRLRQTSADRRLTSG